MVTATRQFWGKVGLTMLCLTVGRAAADHAILNDTVGLGFSTNPRGHHANDINGGQSTWGATHTPTVELFVLTAASSTTQASAAPAPAAPTTEKKAAETNENAKPTPQPRRRLKPVDTMDARALLGARDHSAVDLTVKERAFFQKFASDIEARCVVAMAREKIQPVAGMTVHYIIEIATRDGRVAVREVTSPSNVGTPIFFRDLIDTMSPLPQPDPEFIKSFGEVVRVEVTLS